MIGVKDKLSSVSDRLLANLRFGRSRAHWASWLPGIEVISPTPAEKGEIRFYGKSVGSLHPASIILSRPIDELNIVGSGPSLKMQKLDRLPPSSAILLNGSISLIGVRCAQPFCVVIEDSRFVHRHFKMMRESITPGTLCLFSPEVLKAICRHDSGVLGDKRIVFVNNLRKPYQCSRKSLSQCVPYPFVEIDSHARVGVSLAPEQGVMPAGTVAFTALQFCLASNVKRIGFTGVDISNAAEPRFYETRSSVAYSGIGKAKHRILAGFSLAHSIARHNGILLENYSRVSALSEIGIPYNDRLEAS